MKKPKFAPLADMTTEAAVEALFATPLIQSLGYASSQIAFKDQIQPAEVALGSKKIWYAPDYVLNVKGKPRVVVDAKAKDENLLSWIGQLTSYCITLNRLHKDENPVRFFILTNGLRTLLYKWTEGQPLLDMSYTEVVSAHPKYARLQTILSPTAVEKEKDTKSSLHRFEKKSIEEVNAVFAWCHQYIYKNDAMSQAAGFTEFVKLVFLKLLSDRRIRDDFGDLVWQERFDVPEKKVRFSVQWIESREQDAISPMDSIQFGALINTIEEEIQRGTRKRIFAAGDGIKLSPGTIKAVVRKLEKVFLFGIDVDLNGRLFETFLSATMRGKDLGQFFTPRSVVKLGTKLAQLVARKDKIDKVLDGCCGTGGFLIDALADMWTTVDGNPTLSDSEKARLRKKVATCALYGVDIGQDPNLARLARMNMYLHGDGGTSIFEADFLDKQLRDQPQASLESRAEVAQLRKLLEEHPDGFFDVVVTNPPFAKQYETSSERHADILKSYEIGDGESSLKSSIMFFERYRDVLLPEGRLISVIDDGLLSGKKSKPLRDFILSHFVVRAVISLPGDAFQRSQARVKTSIVVLERRKPGELAHQGPVFMYACRFVGIDDPNRERTLPIDRINRVEADKEIKAVASLFSDFCSGKTIDPQWIVPGHKISDRLDVKSCVARTDRLVDGWRARRVQIAPLHELMKEVSITEEDTIKTANSDEEVRYLVVGYDGFAREGATILASDHTSSKILLRVHTGQVVVSHINAVNGSICVVPDSLDGCVVTNEYTILEACKPWNPWVLWSVLRSPEILSEFLVRASGVGRTRVRWDSIKNVIVPLPDKSLADAIVGELEAADTAIRDAWQKRAAVRSRMDERFGLANETALWMLQAFKPPK